MTEHRIRTGETVDAPKHEIRAATADDLEAVRALLIETRHHTFDAIHGAERVADVSERWHAVETLASDLDRPGTSFLVAVEGGRPIATAYAALALEDTLELFRLYVHPGSQRQGIGQALIARVAAAFPAARRIVLEVERDNLNAVGFYESQGFAASGTMEDCCGRGDDVPALEMTRQHPQPECR